MVWIILGIILAVLVVLVVAAVAVCCVNPGRKGRKEQGDVTGFVHAEGRHLYDGNGKPLTLRGVNLGNWFIQECWMCVSSTESMGRQYTSVRGLKGMRENPNHLTEGQIRALDDLYLDTYITEKDFARIADCGLNCVRIPFAWFNVENEDGSDREDGFARLDWIIGMCRKYGLYAVVDLHGARGSQNSDMHSGADDSFDLYGNERNMELTKALWRKIAARYKDEPVVAGYDLLNETRKAPHKYTGKAQFDFYDELYREIRAVDGNHLTIMECFTFPLHGVNEKNYGWENACISYHIYNRVPVLPQKWCLALYSGMHNLKGYRLPVLIGEYNAWGKEKDWIMTMDYYERHGWSYISWTYKTNGYMYNRDGSKYNSWGMYELDLPPVDVSAATYGEIAAVYGATGTENAKESVVPGAYRRYFKEGQR